MIDWLIERMDAHATELALATPHAVATYGDLVARTRAWRDRLAPLGPGSVVSVEDDYSLDSIAAFLAVVWNAQIVVPLSPDSKANRARFLDIAGVEHRLII